MHDPSATLTGIPAIDHYVRWQETLARTGTHRMASHLARDARCRTPGAEGVGPAALAAITAALFDGQAGVKIRVTDRAVGGDGHTAYLRWDRLFTQADGATRTQSGITEIMVGMDGKIASIIEHWDSMPPAKTGFFGRLFNRQRA